MITKLSLKFKPSVSGGREQPLGDSVDCNGKSWLVLSGYLVVMWGDKMYTKDLSECFSRAGFSWPALGVEEMVVWFKVVPWGYFCRQESEAGTFRERGRTDESPPGSANFFPLTLQGFQPSCGWVPTAGITPAGSRNPTHSTRHNAALLLVSPSEHHRNRNHCTQNHDIEMHAVRLLSIWFLQGFL